MVASGSSDLKKGKSLAWCAFWKLKQVWKSPHMPVAVKVELVLLCCSVAVGHGWSPGMWKTESRPLLPCAAGPC